MNLDEKKKFIINFIYIAVWIIIIFLLFKLTSVYLIPFIIGVIIAHCVQKPAALLSSKTKIKQQNCAAVLSVAIFFILMFIFIFSVWFLYSQLSQILNNITLNIDQLKQYITNFYNWINNTIKRSNHNVQSTIKNLIEDTVNGVIARVSTTLSGSITNMVKRLPSLLISCAVTVVATFYMAKDYNQLKKFVNGVVSDVVCKKATEIKDIFTECFLKFAVGYFWLFIITFSELLVGFLLLDVRHFIMLALLVSLLDLLPVIGTGTILLPWAAVVFFQNDYKTGVGLIILYLFNVVIKNFAEPKIIGKQIGINPLFTLIFIFFGFKIGGFFGMLLLPIVLTVLFTYYRRQIADKNTL